MTIVHLQVVIPGVVAQLRTTHDQDNSSSNLPVIEHFLEHGRCTQLWQADDLSHARVDSWQQSLLYALPREVRHFGAASAQLTWLGEGGQSQAGSCFQITPVHFQVGLDDVRCLMPPPLSGEEAQAIFENLKPLVSSTGFRVCELSSDDGKNWYLWCDSELKINTFSLKNLAQSRLFNLMPQGADASVLRRLMTEVQMLLHGHPINQQRERQGILPVNALWFHGHAAVKQLTHSMKSVVVSNSAYVKGLSSGLDLQCLDFASEIQSLLSLNEEKVLLVLPEQSLNSIDAQWFKGLHAALVRRQINRLDIYLDNWQVSLLGGRWAQLRRRLQGKRQVIKDYFS